MNSLPLFETRLPAHPNVNRQSFHTPDNGLLYVTGNITVVYIAPPTAKNELPLVQHYTLKKPIVSLDFCPAWTSTRKEFAVLDRDGVVSVFNAITGEIIQGHKAHQKSEVNFSEKGALCYIRNGTEILSADQVFVKYCTASNTYTTHVAKSNTKRNQITIIKACPYNPDYFAAGTNSGLILIFDLINFKIIYKLRGHDTIISSLEWMCFRQKEDIQQTPQKPKREIKQIIDTDDMFDAYAFDNTEVEFGVLADYKSSNLDRTEDEKVTKLGDLDGSTFDFVEACQNLRADILQPKDQESSDDENRDVKQDDCKHLDVDNEDDPVDADFVRIENASAIVEEKNQSINETAVDDSVLTRKIEFPNIPIDARVYLASSAKECHIWFWDIHTGAGICKMELKGYGDKTDPNVTISWPTENVLWANSLKGDLIQCSIEYRPNKNSLKITRKVLQTGADGDQSTAVMTRQSVNPWNMNDLDTMWIFTKTRKIKLMKVKDERTESITEYSTVPVSLYSILECPQDRNKIAIAGCCKRITVFNITNMCANQAFCNQIKCKVLSLSWHPTDENILAFGAEEGYVGILNTNNVKNAPIAYNPFSGRGVYQISWGYIQPDGDDKEQCVLLACSNGKLVYFSYSHKGNKAIQIPINRKISAVSAGTNYIALGSDDGYVIILSKQLKELWSSKLSNKYISECSWCSSVNSTKLAVTSMESTIHLFNFETVDATIEVKSVNTLKSPSNLFACVRWNQTDSRIVACSLDGTVYVWDADSLNCLARHNLKTRLFFVNFCPINDNFIMCCGQSETLYFLDIRKHLIEKEDVLVEKPTKTKTVTEIKWAAEVELNSGKLKQEELAKQKKRDKKVANIDENELSESLQQISLSSTVPSTQMKYITIFNLSTKEMNKFPLKCLHSLLVDANTNEDVTTVASQPNSYLNKLLFSNRQSVNELLQLELQNHKSSNTDSIGRLIIPLASNDLEAEIVHHVKSKTLTEQHIAVAPMISYVFWKKCCKAFAFQSIDKGCTLLGLPYLLCCHEINDAIESLCQANYYREAWILAKMHKSENDPIFETISENWIKFHEEKGDLDGAAFIAAGVEKYEQSISILSRKRNACDDTMKLIDLLKHRL